MKKWMGFLLAFMMLFAVVGAVSADEVPQPEAGKKFESWWAIPGGVAQIFYEEEGYRVMIDVTADDGTGAIWEYACYYHEDTDNLVSVSSARRNYTVNPDTGEIAEAADYAYEGLDEENQSSEFSIDADGFLIWNDAREGMGAGLKFADIGAFDGVWKNEGEEAEVEFLWNGQTEDGMFYTVYVTTGKKDADQYALYLMNGTFDPAARKLTAEGTRTVFTKNASGEYDSEDDGESYEAVFSITEDGKLLSEGDGTVLAYDLMGHPQQ